MGGKLVRGKHIRPEGVKVSSHLSFSYRCVAPAVVFPDSRPNSHSLARLAVLLTCSTFAH